MQRVIGLFGKAEAGKTTLANYLVNEHGFFRIAFADALKEMLIKAGMCTHEECYEKKTEQSRWLMQKIATEIFRKQVDENFWVQRTAKKVSEFMSAGLSVVIDDIRFPNEARLVRAYRSRGMLIKVVREQYQTTLTAEQANHDSETSVDKIPVEHLIIAKSGDLKSLYKQIDLYLEEADKIDSMLREEA